MMNIRSLFLFLFLISNGCVDQVEVTPVDFTPVTDLGKYNMKIIPQPPTSADNVRLVVFDECQYNVLEGVAKNGYTISIEKHFNSMMKLPCMLRNDTIVIGKLPVGSYTVNYKLMDLSTQVTNPVSLAISFNLLISK
jgi:hypothetical protein